MKKRHPAIEQLRDASLAWVNEIEGEVDQKAREETLRLTRSSHQCCCRSYNTIGMTEFSGCEVTSATSNGLLPIHLLRRPPILATLFQGGAQCL